MVCLWVDQELSVRSCRYLNEANRRGVIISSSLLHVSIQPIDAEAVACLVPIFFCAITEFVVLDTLNSIN